MHEQSDKKKRGIQFVELSSLRRLQRFRFLTMAGLSLDEARIALNLAATDFGLIRGDSRRKLLVEVLTEGAVVRYCRPFVGTRIGAKKKTSLGASFLEVLSDRERRVHDEVVNIRHKMFAHNQVFRRRMKPIELLTDPDEDQEIVMQIGMRKLDSNEEATLPLIIQKLAPVVEAARKAAMPRSRIGGRRLIQGT